MLVGCSSGSSENGASIGTIEVPGGPNIRVVYAGDIPEEVEINWVKIGMTSFQLHLMGTIKNTSDHTVIINEIAFILDGEQIGHWPPLGNCNLQPYEERDFGWGGVGYSEYSKILEVKIE